MMTTGAPDIDEQMAVLERGCDALYTAGDLRERLAIARREGRFLRVKLGMDPTAPDIHLGHTVVLRKMRQFQDFGHRAVLIIGDFTARIGDPTGKTKTRPVLGHATIRSNAKTYFQQAGRILDTDEDRLEIRYNSEWLSGIHLADTLEWMGGMTVAQMIQRESFKKRLKSGVDISMSELMYPLMQAHDSVAIEADVELGGTDQTFNNLLGRDMTGRRLGRKQIVVIMPILRGIDGVEKMSKSLGNTIAVMDSPRDMFGKTMRIADDLMAEWYTLLTAVPRDEIAVLTDPERTHPRDAKIRLAMDIVTQFHGRDTAEAERGLWQKVMVEGGLRDDVPAVDVARSACDEAGQIWLPKLLKLMALCKSTSEGRRLIAGGGVAVDRQRMDDSATMVTPSDDMVVQVGKRRVARIRLT